MEATSLRFAAAARTLGRAARASGLVVPSFRSPPKRSGVGRTIRRRADGSSTVAVAVRDRPWGAVVADMVEGVVAANQLTGERASGLRDELWASLAETQAAEPDDLASAA